MPHKGRGDHQRRERAIDGIKPFEFDRAVKAQAHHLITQADHRLEEMGYLDPDHRDQDAGAHCWPADGHKPAVDEPDETAGPDCQERPGESDKGVAAHWGWAGPFR